MDDGYLSELVQKYLEARKQNKSIYLDADEFDELVDYFDSEGDSQKAKNVLNSGLLIHPHSSLLLLKQAKFIIYDGDYSKALKLLNNLTSYEYEVYLIKIECYLNLGLHAEATVLIQEILNREDSLLDNVFADLGYVYLDIDNFEEAILYFNKSLKYNPENLEALMELAYAYEMVGKYRESISTINKLLDIDSYNYEAWINIGKLYSLIDEFQKAVDAFDFALTIENDDLNVLKLKAHCLSLCGRVSEAIEIFNTILEEDPTDTSVYFLLSECYQSLELYDEALEFLEKYKDTQEIYGIEYIAKKIQILLSKGDNTTAEQIVTKAIEEEPDSLELHIIMSEIKLQANKFEEAEEYLLDAYNEDTEDDFFLLNMLSIIYIHKGEYTKAISYTEKLIEVSPNHLEIKLRLALLYFEVDDNSKFNDLLSQLTNEELLELFKFVYIPEHEDLFDREQLVFYLNNAREQRGLFKNIKY